MNMRDKGWSSDFTWFIVGLAWLLAACGAATAAGPAGPGATSQGTVVPAREQASGGGDTIKIKTPDDQPVVEIERAGETLTLEFTRGGAASTLRGEVKETGKRKYEASGGGLVAEVKGDDDGFKVRASGGRLLWKVKFGDDKIKISDNEENANAFELEPREGGRVKVSRQETELGNVRYDADRGKIKVEDAAGTELFESNTTQTSTLYGVLLLTAIPDAERYIIMAELLARGR